MNVELDVLQVDMLKVVMHLVQKLTSVYTLERYHFVLVQFGLEGLVVEVGYDC